MKINEDKDKIHNNSINIHGNDYEVIRNNYYNDYYSNYKDIYITDYKDENGNICYRKVEIIPRGIFKSGKKYLGSTKKIIKKNCR